MTDDGPQILARRRTRISQWIELVERDVRFARDEPAQTYHALAQDDYIAIVAMTPQRLIPVVRQFRPAREAYTWELPAGLVDAGEDAVAACRRELKEETGLGAARVHRIGTASPCTGRLSNLIHSFFVETADAALVPEQGMQVRLVSEAELAGLIASGELASQLHLGAILLAELRGFLRLPRL